MAQQAKTESERPNGILAHPIHGRIESGQDDAFGRGISESQFLDYLLAVLGGGVRAETESVCHGKFIVNHMRGPRGSGLIR